MENKQLKTIHRFSPLSKEKFQKIREVLQQVHEDKISEEEALKIFSKGDIANYSLMCQHSDYQL